MALLGSRRKPSMDATACQGLAMAYSIAHQPCIRGWTL